MLVETIEECTKSLEEARKLRNKKSSIDKYEKTVNSLLVSLRQLEELMKALKAIQTSDFRDINLSGEQIKELRMSISDCGNACANQSLSDADVKALSAIVASDKKQVTLLWQNDAKGQAATIESYLNGLMSLLEDKDTAKKVLVSLKTARESEPSEEVISLFETNLKKAHNIADGYKLTSSISDFLDKVRGGNATYEDITEDVRKWIVKAKMGSKIRISF